jgi:hypothetical protein
VPIENSTRQWIPDGEFDEVEFQKFRNHAIANARLCAGDVGWAAAWRNWQIKAAEFRVRKGDNGSGVEQGRKWLSEGKSEFTGIPKRHQV